MNPNKYYFDEIKKLVKYDHIPTQSIGSYYLIIGFEFINCNEYDPFNVPSDILDSSEFSKHTCINLVILCGHMRNKTLSWSMPIDVLIENCQTIMGDQK